MNLNTETISHEPSYDEKKKKKKKKYYYLTLNTKFELYILL